MGPTVRPTVPKRASTWDGRYLFRRRVDLQVRRELRSRSGEWGWWVSYCRRRACTGWELELAGWLGQFDPHTKAVVGRRTSRVEVGELSSGSPKGLFSYHVM